MRAVIDNSPADLEFDLTGCDVEHVRKHVPNASAPDSELCACRRAAVLDRLADFLDDTTGNVSMPERPESTDALRAAANFIRDRIVVGEG